MDFDRIRIRGARQHNLRNLDLDLPRYSLIVFTGLSGSGKSSLAFDTLYAEGQRRYVESLSAYARQFLDQMERPDVDAIEGLSPAIAIDQKTTSRNPRSTVATVTEIYDFLRLLYARVGTAHCPGCGRAVSSQTTQEIVEGILELPESSRVQILAPVVRGRKGEYKKELARFARSGYARVRIDGKIRELGDEIELDRQVRHDIDVVVDRVILREGIGDRLHAAVASAAELGDGMVVVNVVGDGDHLFSKKLACTVCGISVPELTPRSFSFNSPRGACVRCDGLGTVLEFDPDLVIPDPERPLVDGAVAPWRGSAYPEAFFSALAEHLGVDAGAAWRDLSEEVRGRILSGPETVKLEVDDGSAMDARLARGFSGLLPTLQEVYEATDSSRRRRQLRKFMRERACPACDGRRLCPESLAVRIGGLDIAGITALPVGAAVEVLENLEVPRRLRPVAAPLLRELTDRLGFLDQVGLGYLTLDRSAASLSGGESQRIRLATQIGTRLRGVLYVLDEPSIGLHPRDNRQLLDALNRIRDQGNTVIVVEHDEETIREADWVVDLGPGAGEHGGWLVAEGPPEDVEASDNSITGGYLSGRLSIPVPRYRRRPGGLLGDAELPEGDARVPGDAAGPAGAGADDDGDGDGGRIDGEGATWLTVRGARHHNLADIDVSIPLGCFTVVTGVSGSGKSSLVEETLYRELARRLYEAEAEPGPHDAIEGAEAVDKVIAISQDPIGRTPRSNAATYVSAFTPIRQLYASLPESKVRGYDQGRFSFNVKGGRCEECRGGGAKKVEMHFLPDVYVRCEACDGRRYGAETLEIRYRGADIADVLDMSVEQALEHFANVPKIVRKLEALRDVGLGYIRLGQPATTLSGGEAQRVKLAKELARRSTGNTLYILDEPTTGLHFEDIRKLLEVLDQLVEQGNTVVVIEHNLDVVKCADWIVDLGPEGGEDGGRVVATGPPEQIADSEASFTGRYLRAVLQGKPVTAVRT